MFVFFLSRYPSDTNNQIYWSRKKHNFKLHFIGFDFMYCFMPDLPLNFTMCSSMLSSLSFDSGSYLETLVSFIVLSESRQNVDFEGSHKNGFESLCSEYRHYRSDYLLSSIQLLGVTY